MQWSECDRCGSPYPMTQLGYQKGILICYRRCWDNTTIEQREGEIANILGHADQEGVDLRFIDAALVDTYDERSG